MAHEDELAAAWAVLETTAKSVPDSGIDVVPTGVSIPAGQVLVGVDGAGRRYVLVPVRPGEAFAEDRRGRAVQLVGIRHNGVQHIAAVCLQRELDDVFRQFAAEILRSITGAEAPAQRVIEVLASWRRLLSEAGRSGVLTDQRLIGLMAELMTVEDIVRHDPKRRLAVWTGPDAHQHDLRWPGGAIEVKATLVREGRFVKISSVDQLAEPPGSTLHLVHYRFEPAPDGRSLMDAIEAVRNLGVEPGELDALLTKAGYSEADAEHYRARRFRRVERRVYDVLDGSFPRIVPSTFSGGRMPEGTLRLSYTVDLTNTPPHPLGQEDENRLWAEAAR